MDFRKTISSIYYIKPHIWGLEAPITNILMLLKQKGVNIQRINKDWELICISSGQILLPNESAKGKKKQFSELGDFAISGDGLGTYTKPGAITPQQGTHTPSANTGS